MYVCMYVCMYTMILPLHFSVPIYSPWQKKKKKKKSKNQKIKRGAGPLPGPECMYVCIYIPLLTSNFVYIGVASSHRKCAISDIAITSARNNIF